MNLGAVAINRQTIGAAASKASYIGSHPIGDAGPFDLVLFDAVGDWDVSSLSATVYTPALVAPVFDVTDFGADPTNTRDSTSAIRDAIAAQAAAGEGTIYFPAGTYACFANEDYETVFDLYSSGTVIEGDGPTESILNFRSWGGANPAGLIPRRGLGFSTPDTTVGLDGITIRGLRCTGNAPPNNDAGEFNYDPEGAPTGWDVYHKGIGLFGEVTNVLIEDCEWDNWRGELIYGGGADVGNVTIRRNVLRGCNASAVSISGNVVIENTEIYACYNGTECLILNIGQTQTLTDCIVDPNRGLPVGVEDIGGKGIVHLAVEGSTLVVTGCTLGYTISGAIFMAEATYNATIDDNDFVDGPGVYILYQGSYAALPGFPLEDQNRYENLNITNNRFTAETRNVSAAIYGFATPGKDWAITGNVVSGTSPYVVEKFINTRGSTEGFVVTGNTIEDAEPNTHYASDGPRPSNWSTNTVTGTFADGTAYFSYLPPEDLTPLYIYPGWPKVTITDIGNGTMAREIAIDADFIAFYPVGFPLSITRTGNNAANTGAEVKPDATWNDLTRGYMLYDGAVLNLVVGAGGLFELVSYTPPTENIRTITQTTPSRADLNEISFYGQLEVNLSPTVAHTFDTFSGVAIGETVTLNLNSNVTLDHVPGVLEMSTGVDYVSAGTVALSATRAADGTLEVTIP